MSRTSKSSKVSAQIEVSVHKDHLRKLSKTRRPLAAVEELVWNSLDADADRVEVVIDKNLWGGVYRIAVVDDGDGMSPDKALEVFERLGGSWKQNVDVTAKGRRLHGKEGKGRFAAFSLGATVVWDSVALRTAGKYTSCRIESTDMRIDQFLVTGDRTRSSLQSHSGTKVTISDVPESVHGLVGEDAITAMHDKFALYLLQYPSVRLIYNNELIEPSAAIAAIHTCAVSIVVDGETHEAEIDIVEWKRKGPRGIYLCDSEGFSIQDVGVGVNTHNRRITAHVKSKAFEELRATGGLSVGDLHPVVRGFLSQTRKAIVDYHDTTAKAVAAERVQEWRKEQVYPFTAPPKTAKQTAQQEAFVVVANEVEEHVPEVRRQGLKAKRLLFRLLRDAIERGPDHIRAMLSQVLDLTEAQHDDLAERLDKTSLGEAVLDAKDKQSKKSKKAKKTTASEKQPVAP
ncbi:hypothetical protein DB30_03417 [Enhygromyxa salina]|uniref:DNA mismatch repair protein MutL n=1 Tax=Enhygromyxa salina TaxID=215803 RepID=A0A0C2D6T9_9BACT|nr:ATP-binding protein [Enhygromyxa salina]KIG17360.1 hypothetical protein DB30_03417 [Enhygromyxa salina]